MSLDINSLNTASLLPFSITRYIQQLLKRPTDFSSAQKAQSQQYAHPSLQLGPNGSWLDPQQVNSESGEAYLGERGNIAQQDLSNKMNLADLLTQSGSSLANMQNAIPFLEAANIGSGSSIFGALGF